MSWAQLPPHDLGAEAGAISAVLWGDCCAHELEAADFWCPEYRQIWAVVATLEELMGCDANWRLRWLSVLSEQCLGQGLSELPLRQERLLEITGKAWDGPLRKCLARLRKMTRCRRAVELLVAAEAGLRDGG